LENINMKTTKFLLCSLLLTGLSTQAGIIVSESFGGSGADNLNYTTADTFDAAITTAGGSSTWLAATGTNNYFRANGDISPSGNNVSAYLLLGSYIDDLAGTAGGKFELSADLGLPTNGSWVSLGFFQDVDGTYENGNFTATPPEGVATILYRNTGEVDGFGGGAGATTTSGNVQGSTGLTGVQTFTVVLDLTPGGGYNGTDNFGKVTYYEGDTDTGSNIGSFTYTAANTYAGVGFSTATSDGTIDNFTLTVIPEPSSLILVGIGLVGALFLRRRK
jgi:hypothetical protein